MNLSKLAALSVPRISPRGVYAVRRSSEEFAAWRAALGTALGDISSLSADETSWQAEAADAMTSALRPIQTRLEKAATSSAARRALRLGSANFAYSAVGALTGALAGGSIPSGLAGAAGGQGVELAVNYLRNLKRQREGKAELDLVMSFYGEDS